MAEDNVQVSVTGDGSGAVNAVKNVADSVKNLSDQGKAQIDNLTGAFSKLQTAMLAIAAIVAGGAMFSEMVKSTLEQTSEVTKLQKAFGLTVDKADDLADQLQLLGIKTEDYMTMAMRLDRQLRTGSETLAKMGLTAKDLDLGQKGVMDKAINVLAEYKEGVDRNIAATVLFGRSGAEALNLIKLTMAGTAERAKALSDALGGNITAEDQANARSYKTAMNELDMAFDAIRKTIGAAVLPYLTRFAEWFISVAPTLISSMKSTTASVIAWIFDATSAIGNMVLTVIEQINTLIASMDELKRKAALISGAALAGATGGAVLGGPLGALVGAVGGGMLGTVAAEMTTGAEQIEAGNAKIEAARKVFNDNLTAFRNMITNGGPASSAEPFGPPAKGTKSAQGLIDDGGSGKDALSAAMLKAKGEVDLAKETLRQKQGLLELEVSLGQITQNQKYAQLQMYTQQAFQEEMKILQNQLNIAGITLAQRQQVLNKIQMLEAQHRTEMLALDRQSIQAQMAMWSQYTDTVQGSISGQMRGLLAGTTSFSTAAKSIFADLSLKVIETLVTKPVAQYIAGQLAMLTATQTGAAATVAADTAATAAALPVKIAAFTSDLTARAALTFAGIFANMAPIIGPAAAGPAAAGEASVMAQMAAVPKFDVGAWSVPRTGLAVIHQGESILPAGAPADAYRNQMSGRGNGSSGETHLHFHGAMMDGPSIAKVFKQNAKVIGSALSKSAALNPSI